MFAKLATGGKILKKFLTRYLSFAFGRKFENRFERENSDSAITCHDIDECSNGDHNCDSNAQCTNTKGMGFSGDLELKLVHRESRER